MDFDGRLAVADGALPPRDCARLVEEITRYVKDRELPIIQRACGSRDLRYSVIDGDAIAESFPEIASLYAARLGGDVIALASRRVAINVNITHPGGEYRWHYDRNPLTALLYLNEVEGGEIEIYPGYRIEPQPGRLVIMNGNRCLHSVRRVARGMRIALVFAYDLAGESRTAARPELDRYLYDAG